MNVYIPINFPDIDIMVKGTKLKPDKIRAFLHQLFLSNLSQSSYGDKVKENSYNYIYKDGYVSLHSDIMKKILTARYKKYLTFLEENKLVFRRETPSSKAGYTPGVTTIHYKIRNDLLHRKGSNRSFRIESLTDYTTIKSIFKVRELYDAKSSLSSRSLPLDIIHYNLSDLEKTIRLNYSKAEKWVDSEIYYTEKLFFTNDKTLNHLKDILDMDLRLIQSINDGYFKEKVDQFGERLHTPLKRLSKRMRPFIYFDGYQDEDLMCLDISNSQLYFATLLVNQDIVNTLIPEFSIINTFSEDYLNRPDFIEFIAECRNGTIYEKWKSVVNYSSRDEAKKSLFQVLFSRTKSRIPGVKLFRKEYPSVAAFFNRIKSLTEVELPFIIHTYLDHRGIYKEKNYHCNLSCALQRLESRIFLKRIGQALFDNGVERFFTIHDSVYFPKSETETIQKIIASEFEKLGVLPPKIKLSNK